MQNQRKPGSLEVDGGQSEFLSVADGRLEYRWFDAVDTLKTQGPQHRKRALVFLHEALGCVSLWRDVPIRLAALTGLSAFVYSRFGYGRSDPFSLPRPVDFHSTEAHEVLPQVLDAAGIEQAVLIGHSDGGTIALLAAERDPRIVGVVSMAAHVFNEEVTREGIREARRAWETTDLRAKLKRHHGDNVDLAFFGWNDTWLTDAFRDWNTEDGLPQVTCPVLVVQGVDDQYGSVAQVNAIAGGVAGPVETLIIPNCGHAPQMEAPEVLFPAIKNFVTDICQFGD